MVTNDGYAKSVVLWFFCNSNFCDSSCFFLRTRYAALRDLTNVLATSPLAMGNTVVPVLAGKDGGAVGDSPHRCLNLHGKTRLQPHIQYDRLCGPSTMPLFG